MGHNFAPVEAHMADLMITLQRVGYAVRVTSLSALALIAPQPTSGQIAHHKQILFSETEDGATSELLGKIDVGELASGKYMMQVREFTLEPGAKVGQHVHEGPGMRYVLEGTIGVYGSAGQVDTYGAGSTYYEPAGPHIGAYNAGGGRVRIIVVELVPGIAVVR
jgi:quercetin dioxygenase-like cupin family protein